MLLSTLSLNAPLQSLSQCSFPISFDLPLPSLLMLSTPECSTHLKDRSQNHSALCLFLPAFYPRSARVLPAFCPRSARFLPAFCSRSARFLPALCPLLPPSTPFGPLPTHFFSLSYHPSTRFLLISSNAPPRTPTDNHHTTIHINHRSPRSRSCSKCLKPRLTRIWETASSGCRNTRGSCR
jgi:hypothetical protein